MEAPVRVLFASDLHAGMLGWQKRVRRLRRLMMAARPDAVVLLGDLLDTRLASLPSLLSSLLDPERTIPAYAVRGNHDSGAISTDEWTQTLRHHDVTDLSNASAELASGVRIWGLDDGKRGVPSLNTATHCPSDASGVNLVAVHNPGDLRCVPAALLEDIDIAVAGHTHGGQIRLPFMDGRIRPSGYPSGAMGGLTREHGCPAYVNRGVGMTGLPFRFRCPPEVVLLEVVPPVRRTP